MKQVPFDDEEVPAPKSTASVSDQKSSTTTSPDGTTTTTSSGTIRGLDIVAARKTPEWQQFYNEPSSDKPSLRRMAMKVADMKYRNAIASGKIKLGDSLIIKGKKLSEGQVYLLFKRVEALNTQCLAESILFESVFDAIRHQQLDEGPMDALKKAAGAVGGAVGGAAAKVKQAASNVASAGMNKLATAGKNLTTKVTADKLQSAWKKAGSPTDSNAIADILAKAGVNAEVVNTVYGDMGIEAPKAAPAPAEEPAAQDAAQPDNTSGQAGAASGVDLKRLVAAIKKAKLETQVKQYLQTA
jgi:hypothetical protein